MNSESMRYRCAAALLMLCFLGLNAAAQDAATDASPPDPLVTMNNALTAYAAAQSQRPDTVIRYGDADGAVARDLLQPAVADAILDGTSAATSSERMDEIKAVLESYSPIADSYIQAFRGAPADYEQEYLDSYAVMYNLFLATIKPITEIDLDAMPDDAPEKQLLVATRMLVQATPRILLEILREDLTQNRFSETLRGDADRLLQSLNVKTKDLFGEP